MKRSAPAVLAAVCVTLGIGLAALWVSPGGQPRAAVHWQAPAALTGDYGAVRSPLPPVGEPDAQRAAAWLARPLFSRTRRPPEPVAVVPVDAAPDRLGRARLRAIVEGPGASGSIIVEIDGKSHRIQQQTAFEGWTLASMNTPARTVTMTRRGQARVLTLQRGQLSGGAARASVGMAPAPVSRAAPTGSMPRAVPRPGQAAASPSQATDAPAAADAPAPSPVFGGAER